MSGEYSGSDCDGPKREGNLALSRDDRTVLPEVLRLDDGGFMPIDHMYVHGVGFWTLQTDRFFLGASESRVGAYTKIGLYIVNRTGQPVPFDPAETAAFDMVSRKPLRRYSPAEIDKKIYRSARWRAALAGAAEGMGSVDTSSFYSEGDFTLDDQYGNRYSGSVSGTTTTYSTTNNRASGEAANQVWKNAQSQARRFDRNGLLKETIMPGNTLTGSIFFSRPAIGNLMDAVKLDKKGELISVGVQIGTEKFRLLFPVDTMLEQTTRNTDSAAQNQKQ